MGCVRDQSIQQLITNFQVLFHYLLAVQFVLSEEPNNLLYRYFLIDCHGVVASKCILIYLPSIRLLRIL